MSTTANIANLQNITLYCSFQVYYSQKDRSGLKRKTRLLNTHGFLKFCRANCLHCTDTSAKDIQGRSWQAVKFCVKKKLPWQSEKRILEKTGTLDMLLSPSTAIVVSQEWTVQEFDYQMLQFKHNFKAHAGRLWHCTAFAFLPEYKFYTRYGGYGGMAFAFKPLNFYSIISYTASMFYP